MKQGLFLPFATALTGIVSLGLVLLAMSGCRPRSKVADPALLKAEKAWRQQRLARLTAPDGWLTLVGLHWLRPGENSAGSAPSSRVPLPGAPPETGTFILSPDGTVVFEAAPGAGVTLNGQKVTRRVLRSDAEGGPDILHVGRLLFYVIKRGDRLAVRVKDPQSPRRTHFLGLDYFPVDASYRVTATFEPFAHPKTVTVPTVVGVSETMEAPGLVHFTLHGMKLSLEPLIESPGDTSFFFIFRDATSGKETYGAGRFLDAPAPKNGTLVLDFNRAYNPPCAFTPYATCPLPPPENVLPVAIRAGEKKYRGGHGA